MLNSVNAPRLASLDLANHLFPNVSVLTGKFDRTSTQTGATIRTKKKHFTHLHLNDSFFQMIEDVKLNTGVSISPDVCCASACNSIAGESSTIRWTDIYQFNKSEIRWNLIFHSYSKYWMVFNNAAKLCHKINILIANCWQYQEIAVYSAMRLHFLLQSALCSFTNLNEFVKAVELLSHQTLFIKIWIDDDPTCFLPQFMRNFLIIFIFVIFWRWV